MRRILICTVLLFAATSVAHAATEMDFLLQDLKFFEDEIKRSEQSEDLQDDEWEYQSKVDLFPHEGSALLEEEDPELQEELARTFVTIKVDDDTVVNLDDVPLTIWFAPYVKDMARKNIISGYKDVSGRLLGKYGPADNVTIDQLAKISVEAAGVDKSECPDVPKNTKATGTWSQDYISCAEFLRWSVYRDGEVDPLRPAKRAEVVLTVLEAFHRYMEQATGGIFKDVSEDLPSRHAIETAARDGIVSGYTDSNGNLTGNFGPFDNVNRAETAKIVSLAMKIYEPGSDILEQGIDEDDEEEQDTKEFDEEDGSWDDEEDDEDDS